MSVNARDAMPEGGKLTITAVQDDVLASHPAGLKPAKYVRLSVSDTGVGMDEATCDRAIEPFFSTKGIGKGTGLGLSMAHGLAAQLGGGLTIKSWIGNGTTVELFLPTSELRDDDAKNVAALAMERTGPGTVLLVDDEELVRMSTADMLLELGFAVTEAASANEALGLMTAANMPQLLITDHLMPGMSGADLAREARKLSPTMPILIMSGYADVDAIAPDLPRLTKPFRSVDLAASISELLAHDVAEL